ncbi:MAG TPA: PD-(D/E)XK nuclease family protein [Candidatus Nanoarchaeia archaeon]|nr:PD-(D/E)XK nuclease family protein [Candidatus Nanoarchaeia archaeon]
MTRIESPSSINTYNTCQRKYFYHYKLGLPLKDSLPTLTGKAVHAALEHFYTFDPATLNIHTYEEELRNHLLNSFNKAWVEAVPHLSQLGKDKDTIKEYYEDSLSMLGNFFQTFLSDVREHVKNSSLQKAFLTVRPETEVFLSSEHINIRGYIDAIHTHNGQTCILDYKTGRSDELTEEYKLQLAIYALLYQEQHKKLPDKLGLYFLRNGTQKYINVNQDLIDHARDQCSNVHSRTTSDNIEDYPKNLGSWCKWCDFKDYCFGQKTLIDYASTTREQ